MLYGIGKLCRQTRVIGLPEAMATISEGQRITVDALAGVIYEGAVSIL